MSELMSQLITPELMTAFTIFIVLLVVLYILSIVWVIRDAYMRGTRWYVWGIVALVPLLGVVAYCLLRPPLLQIDRDEQELEVALKQRELRLPGRVRLRAVPELPRAPEEPVPELPPRARTRMDGVSVLRHAGGAGSRQRCAASPPASAAGDARRAGSACSRAACATSAAAGSLAPAAQPTA